MSQQQQSQQNQQQTTQPTNQPTNSNFDAFTVGSGFNFNPNIGSSASHSAQQPNLRPPVNEAINLQGDEEEDDFDESDNLEFEELTNQLMNLYIKAKEKNITFNNVQDLVVKTTFEEPVINKEKSRTLQQQLNYITNAHSTNFHINRANELTNDKLKNDYNFLVLTGKMVERMFKVQSFQEMTDIMNLVL